ncbi:MAG TPA: glycoside hydrolase family 2 TIM barrel-domain containing protein, partial [Fimbriimonadaceae bacterium]|nr:glycoside hydrolase family 2 TIM barrel-domain containing protein [Fimbriimonadaceae bacterium]
MKRGLLLLIALMSTIASTQTLQTRWASSVTPANVHREYPRPQMVRKNWVNLNGPWDCAVVPQASEPSAGDFKKILVPFPVESQLSGFHGHVKPTDKIVYTRTFTIPHDAAIRRTAGRLDQTTGHVLLHFGAVDWKTTVYVNDKKVGEHTGGYDPFTVDVTEALTEAGPQKLTVVVTDPTDAGYQPRGKQVLKPGGIFYTPVSGIWQTVWLEAVPQAYIASLKIETWPRAGQVNVASQIEGNTLVAPPYGDPTCKVRVEILENGKVIAHSEQPVFRGDNVPEDPGYAIKGNPITNTLKVASHIDWSPDNPHLYDLRITLLERDKVLDEVTSYFGFREISLVKDASGQPRIALNGKPIFLIGPLDQGFWPDGIYTAPSDEAMKYDLEVTKRLGFNMIRKHVKVEPERWYYWCDKLGIAVLQDMPSGDKSIGPDDPDIERSPESAADFRQELQAMVDTHFNSPCIVTWVLYNEGWGQWNTAEMTAWLKNYDKSRLVDSTTGWTDRKVGDYSDVHDYPGPGAPPNEENRAIFLGEFGGLGLPVPGHMWLEKGWGYQSFKTKEQLTDRFVQLFTDLRLLQSKGLSGAVYTQTTDCETELNGLMTYDRAMIKMDEGRVRKAVESLFLPPPTVTSV